MDSVVSVNSTFRERSARLFGKNYKFYFKFDDTILASDLTEFVNKTETIKGKGNLKL